MLPHSHTSVLIIDDSEAVRTRVRRALSERDTCSRFLMAGDGIEGFKLLLSAEVDVILCDMVMPGIDGLKFLGLKQSRSEFKEIPVIMLTGQEDVKAKVRCLEAGASDYLTKPFYDEELVARVNVHLKLRALQAELQRKNARLEELSRTDDLTKITNRRHIMEALELEFLRAERYQRPLALIMADIDHFKRVNDEHGHALGDEALVVVANTLQNTLRQHDSIGRYGGEEFLLLLPETDASGAGAVAERCRQEVERCSIVTESGEEVRVTISMGVATTRQETGETPDALVKRADEALYVAKRAGRNRVHVAD